VQNMGNLLKEGSGKDSNAIVGWIAYYVVGALISFVLAYVLGYTEVRGWMGTTSVRNSFWYFFVAIGIVEVILAPLTAWTIAKTRIKVYENGVVGTGISKWFYLGDIRTFDFMLSYEQVTVDLNGGQIVVHGAGTHYKVYVNNGTEIQQSVFRQKNGIPQSVETPENSMPTHEKKGVCITCDKEFGSSSCTYCAHRPA